MREVVGLLLVLFVGGLAAASRMGWHPRLWERFRARRQVGRATRWLQKRYPSDEKVWSVERWLEASEAVGGPFMLVPETADVEEHQ
jgi:hypothetical protein